jgi:O-methyltransferase
MSLFVNVRRFKNKQEDPTIINNEQLDYLVSYALDVLDRNIEGDFVELGCYVGESSKFLRKALVETKSEKDLYVYDSFEGLPPVSIYEESTGWKEGGLKTTDEVLVANFRQNGLKIFLKINYQKKFHLHF